jgi:hypothetical protein
MDVFWMSDWLPLAGMNHGNGHLRLSDDQLRSLLTKMLSCEETRSVLPNAGGYGFCLAGIFPWSTVWKSNSTVPRWQAMHVTIENHIFLPYLDPAISRCSPVSLYLFSTSMALWTGRCQQILWTDRARVDCYWRLSSGLFYTPTHEQV